VVAGAEHSDGEDDGSARCHGRDVVAGDGIACWRGSARLLELSERPDAEVVVAYPTASVASVSTTRSKAPAWSRGLNVVWPKQGHGVAATNVVGEARPIRSKQQERPG
jgi:hypothetical protein